MTTIHWTPQYSSTVTPCREGGAGGQVEVVVVHTSIPATLVALKTAATLAKGLSARVRLLVPQVVPYALPLETPPVPISFTERRFRTVAEKAAVETTVEIVLCRDITPALETLLRPRSLIVVGARSSSWWGRAWPSAETRLARRLRRLGHQVVFANSH
ncbi:MAG: universal stress protein [Bryobacteraceae bacterium]|jgi:hypothetical protein